jgi:DNA-binding NarL/FixJ family response regulator
MNTAVRRVPASANELKNAGGSTEQKNSAPALPEAPALAKSRVEKPTRVYVAAENRLLREALSRMLTRSADIEVVGRDSAGAFTPEQLLTQRAEILLLTARGNPAEDIAVIRQVRTAAPHVRILLVGATGAEAEFFQYVRAGIRGYLPREASAEDVLAAMQALRSGEAVCPGPLCAALFHFFECEANSLPSASVHQKLGLTRREQQIVPLIAKGLTNKEIANQFCLSQWTVRNHLYRMMQRTGAPNRLGLVQLCRAQGFVV